MSASVDRLVIFRMQVLVQTKRELGNVESPEPSLLSSFLLAAEFLYSTVIYVYFIHVRKEKFKVWFGTY